MKFGGRGFVCVLAGAVAAAAVVATSVQAQEEELPEGPGKAELTQTCTRCHTTAPIIALKRPAQEWNELLTRMMGMGAQVSDDQYDAILGYLTAHYGRSDSTVSASAAPASAAKPAAPAPATAH